MATFLMYMTIAEANTEFYQIKQDNIQDINIKAYIVLISKKGIVGIGREFCPKRLSCKYSLS